jgi:triosephosphate isomerase
MIWVNFKTYEQGTGEKAVRLAQICAKVASESRVKIVVCVQATDIFRVASKAGIEVWTQHVDEVEFGKHTGYILPEGVVKAGGKGTFLNHSERKLSLEAIEKTIERLKSLRCFKTLVCAATEKEAVELAKLKPDFLAYEPEKLIGSKKTSVADAKPEVIKRIIEKVEGVPVVIGAGVHKREDIVRGLEWGCRGFIVATDVVLAEDPEERLRDLVAGYKGLGREAKKVKKR